MFNNCGQTNMFDFLGIIYINIFLWRVKNHRYKIYKIKILKVQDEKTYAWHIKIHWGSSNQKSETALVISECASCEEVPYVKLVQYKE